MPALWRNKRFYDAVHQWIRYHKGSADHCDNTECTRNSNIFQWANKSKEYLRELSDWQQLCLLCHRRFDSPTHCKNGHEFTPDNTCVRQSENRRVCITCRRTREAGYRARNRLEVKNG